MFKYSLNNVCLLIKECLFTHSRMSKYALQKNVWIPIFRFDREVSRLVSMRTGHCPLNDYLHRFHIGNFDTHYATVEMEGEKP